MAPAAQDLRRNLQCAEILDESWSRTHCHLVLTELPVETRSPRVDPASLPQRRNHDDRSRVPCPRPHRDDVPAAERHDGLRFPAGLVVTVAQPAPASAAPRESRVQGHRQHVLRSTRYCTNELVPQTGEETGTGEEVLLLLRNSNPLPGPEAQPSVRHVPPGVNLPLLCERAGVVLPRLHNLDLVRISEPSNDGRNQLILKIS
mmetsp:Transcript_28281/g.53530  ORF Transcript_28281/g.53530 Transcript_28281/m.53530 type:complete len:203 (-) Transcript_28281:185-793(-)